MDRDRYLQKKECEENQGEKTHGQAKDGCLEPSISQLTEGAIPATMLTGPLVLSLIICGSLLWKEAQVTGTSTHRNHL